jgi:hypothetical protein
MTPNAQPPPPINFILSFLLVGLAWGLTTPFIRRAAKDHRPPPHALLAAPSVQQSWWKRRALTALFAVVDLLRNPRYAVPLVLNLTGSVWFFLLIGKAGMFFSLLSHSCFSFFSSFLGGTKTLLETDSVVVELSLTVPIVNTVAFLFTVIGEWWVEGKVISRGMSPVLLVVTDGDADSPRYHGWDGVVCWRDCPVRA